MSHALGAQRTEAIAQEMRGFRAKEVSGPLSCLAGVAGKSRESEAALLLGGRPRPTLTKPALQFVVKRKPAKLG